ncbi:unnamed protein product [Symbiodinium sp. CCMP2592]|nr:unnamed protein product [Symbiodinium sp. CCMP2592]
MPEWQPANVDVLSPDNAVVLSRQPFEHITSSLQACSARLLRFVCSAGECGQLLLAAEAGWQRRKPASPRESATILPSDFLVEQMMLRLRPWVPEECLGKQFWGMARQWTFVKLQPGQSICISNEGLSMSTTMLSTSVLIPLNMAGAQLNFKLARSNEVAGEPCAVEQGSAILHMHPQHLMEVRTPSRILHVLWLQLLYGIEEKSRQLARSIPSSSSPECAPILMSPPPAAPVPPAVPFEAPSVDPACELVVGCSHAWELGD